MSPRCRRRQNGDLKGPAKACAARPKRRYRGHRASGSIDDRYQLSFAIAESWLIALVTAGTPYT